MICRKEFYERKVRKDATAGVDKIWRAACAAGRGPTSAYDRAKAIRIAGSIKCESVKAALEFLAEATEDDVFAAAALALDAYGLISGGLRRQTLKILADARVKVEWSAMLATHQFVEDGATVKQAARFAAVVCAVPGTSVDSITDDIRKAYPTWLKMQKSGTPLTPPPSGDTGRRLKVQVRMAFDDETGHHRRSGPMPAGAVELADGFLSVPDDRHWRRWVVSGHAVLFGVVKS